MRILIIEDERKLAKILGRALKDEGYAVDIEHDSSEGYAMASTQPYDAMIVDRMMPGEFDDGVAMIKQLRKQGILTPVIILTALGELHQKTTGLDAGADDYLTKPFAIDELLARLRAVLRRPHQTESTVLKAGNLQLDTASRTVSFAGEVVDLTVKEYSLLQYLMKSAGQTLSKNNIIEHVWDFDADILPNTVEAYIKALRKKIDEKYNVKYIKTVRGIGYRLEADA